MTQKQTLQEMDRLIELFLKCPSIPYSFTKICLLTLHAVKRNLGSCLISSSNVQEPLALLLIHNKMDIYYFMYPIFSIQTLLT